MSYYIQIWENSSQHAFLAVLTCNLLHSSIAVSHASIKFEQLTARKQMTAHFAPQTVPVKV